MRIGPQLRKLRIDRGETLQQVADRLGVGYATISRWENESRAPSYEDLERWGRALGVEIDIVVRQPRPGGEVEMSPRQSRALGRFARDLPDVPDDKIGILLAVLDSILEVQRRE